MATTTINVPVTIYTPDAVTVPPPPPPVKPEPVREFKIYDSLNCSGERPLVGERIHGIYGHWFRKKADGSDFDHMKDIPDAEEFDRALIRPPNGTMQWDGKSMVFLDLEGPKWPLGVTYLTDGTLEEREARVWDAHRRRIVWIDALRKHDPNIEVCCYGVPTRLGIHSFDRFASTLLDITRAFAPNPYNGIPLASYVAAHCPNFYQWGDDTDGHIIAMEETIAWLAAMNDHREPVVPFVWHRYGNSKEPLPLNVWRRQIESLYLDDHCAGVIWWSDTSESWEQLEPYHRELVKVTKGVG